MKGERGINRKGLTALLVKLEKDAQDGRREFKKYGYYSGSVLTYKQTLTAIRAVKSAYLERSWRSIQRKMRHNETKEATRRSA